MASARRIGAPDAKNRIVLLDAAEALMIEEGYVAVTARRVAERGGNVLLFVPLGLLLCWALPRLRRHIDAQLRLPGLGRDELPVRVVLTHPAREGPDVALLAGGAGIAFDHRARRVLVAGAAATGPAGRSGPR